MYNRRTYGADNLGNPESLDDKNQDGSPVRTNHKYYLRFTNSRKSAFKAIFERTMKTLNPP